MTRLLSALVLLFMLAPMHAQAARAAASCSISPNPLQMQSPATGFYVSASVPRNAVVYLRFEQSNEWTSIPQTRGEIVDAFMTYGFGAPGTYTAQLIDYRRGDQDNVIATCTVEVVP